MGGGQRKRKFGRLLLDFDVLLNEGDDKPTPQLVVVKDAVTVDDDDEDGEEEESDKDQSLKKLSEKELNDKIARAKKMLAEMVFVDGGDKLRATLKGLELELRRRMLLKGDENCKKATPVADEYTCAGATEGRSTGALNVPASQSTFSSLFRRHLGDNIDCGETKAFIDELSTLNPCDHKNAKVKGDLQSQSTHDICLSSRQAPFKSPGHFSINIDEPSQSNSENSDKGSTGCLTVKAKAPHCRPSRSSRRNNQKSVVVVDGEEMEDDLTDLAEKVDKSIEENRIYYPSRDDPKATVICYSDVECLDPESFLSCTIMNFYIRYLQKTSPATTEKCNCHFFNTYFYKKLQLDVLNKIDRETSFVKFRRWWKGVNIFEKAYIFIPIHESLHWSLVIICIPDKEDESGITILHLDSLKLHPSKSIFKDVKSFLIEEWNYMRKGEGEVLSELPIADNVWHKLSRRIFEKVIEVPQQKNEYDCGIFVLFFMERFLSDAPERLKKKDLDKFGREWFKPEQASDLRLKIRNLLKEEFAKSNEGIHNSDS